MLSGVAVINTSKRTVPYRVALNSLQIVQIAAHATGFDNLDLKDNDEGSYTLVAYSKDKSITRCGTSKAEVVEKMLEALGYE